MVASRLKYLGYKVLPALTLAPPTQTADPRYELWLGVANITFGAFMRITYAVSIILATAALVGCVTTGGGSSTQQPVQKIAFLNPGMSKQEVAHVMGTPARTEFAGSKEAWHFCRTGRGSDEFAVIVFTDGKVTAAKNYTVTLADTGGATGDCSRFVRSVLR